MTQTTRNAVPKVVARPRDPDVKYDPLYGVFFVPDVSEPLGETAPVRTKRKPRAKQKPKFKVSETPPPYRAAPLERVIELAQVNDTAAFAELFNRLHGKVLAFVGTRIHSYGDDQQEIASETWERVWKSLRTYSPDNAEFLSWVYGIARHACADFYRKQSRNERKRGKKNLPVRRYAILSLDAATASGITAADLDDHQINFNDPTLDMRDPVLDALLRDEVDAERQRQGRFAREQLFHLDETTSELIHRHVLEDKTYASLSVQFGLSIPAIQGRVERGLAALRRKLLRNFNISGT